MFSRASRLLPTLIRNRNWSSTSQAMVKQLTYLEINQKLKSPAVLLLDVREKSELQTDGKIDSSKNIPVGEVVTALKMSDDDFSEKYEFAKPKPTSDIVIHCKAGVRAVNAAKVFIDSGYANIQVYPGILDWIENGEVLNK
ncbi:putative thiosulfate sulfurtransferase, mitochondrial [Orchesella cincta]|uniref:Putative thiosulfate sulfurtransferase, mitochondrial n=1 Tax=Orchesella cincta TaxID=48709 RepID=A0A1D2N798_ORCCI|nr:putative thiosulfate sulfurtransferase, mitochondrial [Orchesella cincta]